ncbi:hypothetical protein Tco_0490008 [Tanacetum coccineum]
MKYTAAEAALASHQGFDVIVPSKATMEHTIIASTEAKSRKDGGTRSIAPTRDGRIFSRLERVMGAGTKQVQNDGKHSTDEKLIPVKKPNVSEIKDHALLQAKEKPDVAKAETNARCIAERVSVEWVNAQARQEVLQEFEEGLVLPLLLR